MKAFDSSHGDNALVIVTDDGKEITLKEQGNGSITFKAENSQLSIVGENIYRIMWPVKETT